MTQYHHVDESGDPGLSSKTKGSTYFVIAMVQLGHSNGLDLTVELITQLALRASPLDIAEDILVLDAAPPLLNRQNEWKVGFDE